MGKFPQRAKTHYKRDNCKYLAREATNVLHRFTISYITVFYTIVDFLTINFYVDFISGVAARASCTDVDDFVFFFDESNIKSETGVIEVPVSCCECE